MRKSAFWKADWFLGIAATAVVALLGHAGGLLPDLERSVFDLGIALASRAGVHGVAAAVPAWAGWTETSAFVLVAAYLASALPRLRAGSALLISGGMLLALIAVQLVLAAGSGVRLQLMTPAVLLLLGHGVLLAKRFIAGARAAAAPAAGDSREMHRLLGLAYQGQGQLDRAWEEFRQAPVSAALLDNLYHLGLEYERRRQFNKADAVFRQISGIEPAFRDLKQRLARANGRAAPARLGAAPAKVDVEH